MDPIIDVTGYTTAELCRIITMCDEELQARSDQEFSFFDDLEADMEEYCAGG